MNKTRIVTNVLQDQEGNVIGLAGDWPPNERTFDCEAENGNIIATVHRVDAIQDILSEKFRYYVEDENGNNKVEVKVHLQTEADPASSNNLDYLPPCFMLGDPSRQ